MRLWISAALAALVVSSSAWAQTMPNLPPGTFDFCPRPVRPVCVDDNDTYTKPASRKACDEEMARFVKATFDYRTCLTIQMENVIRETNKLAEKFRCKADGKRTCG
ncbi:MULTISPECIES: hypothetical protein [unclassified Beijerinckia]|uniref:hypothetical protein n=1 Tax=unclassified Beijerinckia TaxID=2638183 RepID=UPI0008991012|nr:MULTISPECIES: hypothetical protein [unclassified Beijerinckia]MDH7798140.1 hypothetical protein [Beijerinckia sp. GAS462]SED10462.1 hypothetical protein SAMN05443249_4433 [Beijerinckia sp. 28-YEA-48]